MSRSLSAIERHNAPPRRKSCANCIKAKRRCDLREPACLRCAQRRITCSYPARRTAASIGGVDVAEDAARLVASPAAPELTSAFAFNSNLWETELGPGPGLDLDQSFHSAKPNFPSPMFGDQAAEGLGHPSTGSDILGLEGLLSMDFSMLADESEPLALVALPDTTIASPPRHFSIGDASLLIERRLRYSIDEFQRAPQKMLLGVGTAWSHPALYRDSMPVCLEEAVSACALHCAKNPINAPVFERIIESKYRDLLATSSPPSPSSSSGAREVLARTHALLLYQAMLFLDPGSSHAARAAADRTCAALAESAAALARHVRRDDPGPGSGARDENSTSTSTSSTSTSTTSTTTNFIPLYPLATARAAFRDWTFQESLRRTLFVAVFYLQMQAALLLRPVPMIPPDQTGFASSPSSSSSFSPSSPTAAGGGAGVPAPAPAPGEEGEEYVSDGGSAGRYGRPDCDPRFALCPPFTLSARVWRAADAAGFAAAWGFAAAAAAGVAGAGETGRPLEATPADVTAVLVERAAPDDVDEFGRMLLSSALGMEDARAWFESRGGVF
ncbi:hypothetical protein GGR56DRAFT_692283 [Xylariaceae sp. FL0804]|nr:hypothetical protein GGR56DRAFT_692283 [Xylariaceae sp. FL0804]